MKDAFDTLSEQQEKAGKAVQANQPPKDLKCPVCKEQLYAEVRPTRLLWKCADECFIFSEAVSAG